VRPAVHAGNCTGFFFNQIKWTVSDSEDTGHRDTKPIGGLFVKIDRSADNSEAGHRTGALWSFRVCPTPLQPAWLGADHEARHTAAGMI